MKYNLKKISILGVILLTTAAQSMTPQDLIAVGTTATSDLLAIGTGMPIAAPMLDTAVILQDSMTGGTNIGYIFQTSNSLDGSNSGANYAIIKQTSTMNLALINQQGQANTAGISQDNPLGSSAYISQTLSGNTAFIEQK